MSYQEYQIPALAKILFRSTLPADDFDFLMGDYEEIFRGLCRSRNSLHARCWLFSQWFKSGPLYLAEHIRGECIMLSSTVKTAVRKMIKERGYSLINLLGLALGMASSLLILMWVMNELQYDRFHEKLDHIYQIEMDDPYPQGNYHVTVGPYPMGPAVAAELSEIQDFCRVSYVGNMLFQERDRSFFDQRGRAVDASFLDLFTFPLSQGDPETALKNPNSIVLTRELATKIFGATDPIGREIVLNGNRSMQVTGVLATLPRNSSLTFTYLVNLEFMRYIGRWNDNWRANNLSTYLMLMPNADADHTAQLIAQIRNRHALIQGDGSEAEPDDYLCSLRPLKDVHLHQYFGFHDDGSTVKNIILFSTIAALVLLMACINFMNLATARAATRAKEIGLRKTVGATRHALMWQFYGETVTMTLVSLVMAFLFIALFLPVYNNITGQSLEFSMLLNGWGLFLPLGVALITAAVAGSYPALHLSSMQAGLMLRNRRSSNGSAGLRRLLVVAQFAMTIVLLTAAMTVLRQLQYMENRDVGYDRSRLAFVEIHSGMRPRYNLLKERLSTIPDLVGVSGGSNRPAVYYSNGSGAEWPGQAPDDNIQITFNVVDFDYCKTMGIQMAAGRPLNPAMASDSSNFLINETLARYMNQENIIGTPMQYLGVDGLVVGVMKDFSFKSAKTAVEPLAIVFDQRWINFVYLRLSPGPVEQQIASIRDVWQDVFPGYPFEIQFVSDDYQWIYANERTLGGIIQTFTVLTVIISVLGLLGLASYTAQQRSREIAIRKVLGASVSSILRMLTSEFTRWIIFANAIGLPIAWYILNRWIQGYADHAGLAWWIFVLAGGSALFVAIASVLIQTLRSSLANPVQAIQQP